MATLMPPKGTTVNYTLQNTIDASKYSRSIALTLLMLSGFILSCVLLGTVAQSRTLKRSRLNLLLLNLSVGKLLESLFNMSLVLAASFLEEWQLGDIGCRLNASFLQLCSVQTILGIMAATIERALAVKYDSRTFEKKMRPVHRNLLILFTWIQALAFSAPLLAHIEDSVQVVPFPRRYLCFLQPNSSVLFVVLTSVFCYSLPVLVIISLFIVILKKGLEERKKQQALIAQIPRGFENGVASSNPIWDEIDKAKFVFTLFMVWAVLEGPYLAVTYMEQFRGIVAHRSDVSGLDYPAQLDVAFVWMRFANATVLCLIIFIWRREVWEKFRDMTVCRRSNIIVDSSGRGVRADGIPHEATANGSSFKPAVLFATSTGLHMHRGFAYETDDSEAGIIDQDPRSARSESRGVKVKTSRQCDVEGSREYLQDDTSDYDSEMDPFSTSNPISAKQAAGVGAPAVSQTRPPPATAGQAFPSDAKVTGSHDSGIHVLNGGGSGERKKNRHRHDSKSHLEEFDSRRVGKGKEKDDDLTVTRVYNSKTDLKEAARVDANGRDSPPVQVPRNPPSPPPSPVPDSPRGTDGTDNEGENEKGAKVENGSAVDHPVTDTALPHPTRKLSDILPPLEPPRDKLVQGDSSPKSSKRKKKKKKKKKTKLKDMATSPIPLDSHELSVFRGPERVLTPPARVLSPEQRFPILDNRIASPDQGVTSGDQRLATPGSRLSTPERPPARLEPLPHNGLRSGKQLRNRTRNKSDSGTSGSDPSSDAEEHETRLRQELDSILESPKRQANNQVPDRSISEMPVSSRDSERHVYHDWENSQLRHSHDGTLDFPEKHRERHKNSTEPDILKVHTDAFTAGGEGGLSSYPAELPSLHDSFQLDNSQTLLIPKGSPDSPKSPLVDRNTFEVTADVIRDAGSSHIGESPKKETRQDSREPAW